MAVWELPRDPLAALREGDPGPFEAFVRSHARIFFAFFRRQGAGLHKAEDLTQEVFLKLYQHAGRYRPEDRLGAFSLRVARNVWIDDRRRAGARPPAGASREAAPDRGEPEEGASALEARRTPDPLAHAALSEEAGRLRSALAELPDHHREVFELGAIEELPYADIAATLGIPVGTVKSRMYHAVRKLRGALEGEEEGAA